MWWILKGRGDGRAEVAVRRAPTVENETCKWDYDARLAKDGLRAICVRIDGKVMGDRARAISCELYTALTECNHSMEGRLCRRPRIDI